MSAHPPHQVCVVTGGNRGIGLEVSRGLAALGHTVVLTARDPDLGERAAASLRGDGLDVLFHPLDVRDHRQVERLREHMRADFSSVGVLVNNAGIVPDEGDPTDLDAGSVLRLSDEVVRRGVDTNLLGPLALCRALVPSMIAAGWGRVVNVSSGMGALTDMDAGWPAYRISKTALNALTAVLAAECRGTGVLVNAVCPGGVRTRIGPPDGRSVPEGAAGVIWAATLPDDGPTGGFFRDGQPIPW